MAIAPLLLLFVLVWIGVAVTRSATVPAAALADLTSHGADRPLYERFFARSRRFRSTGAIAGWCVAGLVAFVIATEDGRDGGATLDLTLIASIALAGSVLGSVLAEGFRLRRPRSTRTVSLTVREPGAYADPVAGRRERAVLAIAVLAVVISLSSNSAITVSVLGAIVLGLAALRAWSTRRIAHRPRPALSPALAAADDEIRRLAASVGLGRPLVTLEVIVVSWQYRVLSADIEVLALATLALLLVAVVWWFQNRSFGLVDRARLRGFVSSAPRLRLIATIGLVVVALFVIALRLGS